MGALASGVPFGRLPGMGAVAFLPLPPGGSRDSAPRSTWSPARTFRQQRLLLPCRRSPRSMNLKRRNWLRTRRRTRAMSPPPNYLSNMAPQSGLFSPDLLSQKDRDLTGLAQAISFYKSGDLAQGDAVAAASEDKISGRLLNGLRCGAFLVNQGSSGCRPSCRRIQPGPRSTG